MSKEVETQLRRNRVLELGSEGLTQQEIDDRLNILSRPYPMTLFILARKQGKTYSSTLKNYPIIMNKH
jgi:orotate phosphoribosyltransferase-like protein